MSNGWHDRINQSGNTALAATMEVIETFAGVTVARIPEILMDQNFVRSGWQRYLDIAEAYYERPSNYVRVALRLAPDFLSSRD